MKIEFTSTDQFNSLLDALAGEIVDAGVFFKLHMDLLEAHSEYKKVFIESRTFWGLTIRALLDATLIRLCRIYDQHSASLNLRNLLDTIKANLEIFDNDNFRERLRDNPFVESLAQTARKPKFDVLSQDMASVDHTDSLVRKLVIWRNTLVAHKSVSNVLKEKNIADDYPLTRNEISDLLNRATSILNRYSGLFRASTYSTQITGHDDYLYVLKATQEKLHMLRQKHSFNPGE
ncbi:MAG: hypothetical protein SVM79_06955 [Chloroflexota bacterium]|nr:hypothetical protein [Chloroflexota bacterium]